MKKLFAALMLVFLSTTLFAQPKEHQVPKSPKHKMNPEKMLMGLKHRLLLNDDQFSDIKEIVFNAEKQMVDIRAEQLEQKMQMMEKRKSVMDKTAEKISDLLDEEQLKKFEQMKAEREMIPPPPPKKGEEQLILPPPPKK